MKNKVFLILILACLQVAETFSVEELDPITLLHEQAKDMARIESVIMGTRRLTEEHRADVRTVLSYYSTCQACEERIKALDAAGIRLGDIYNAFLSCDAIIDLLQARGELDGEYNIIIGGPVRPIEELLQETISEINALVRHNFD